jgi:hypothetical protein
MRAKFKIAKRIKYIKEGNAPLDQVKLCEQYALAYPSEVHVTL